MTDTDAILTSSKREGEDAKSKRDRGALTKVLPTDRVAFDKQVALLRAFAAVYAANGGKPVTNDQAGEVISPKLSGSTVSQTNGFFCDVGLLARSDKGGFVPVSELIDYNETCTWDEAEARIRLRPIFEKAWFYRCLVPRLQLAPQPQATCLALLASESKATTEHIEKLENLIRFLELAGIVSGVGGTVALLQHRQSSTNRQEQPKPNGSTPPPAAEDKAENHVLFLDKEKKRKVVLVAPLSISRTEYDRICKWIEVVLIVEEIKP